MKPKLFAVDLDGTLLDKKGRVHEVDLDAIRKVERAGVAVTIITGRLHSGARSAARQIDAKAPMACVDGAHIVDAVTGEELFHDGIAGEAAALLREAADVHAPTIFVFANDEIVHDERGEPYLPFVQTWSPRFVRHARATEHPHWDAPRGITSLVAVGPKDVIDGTEEEIRKRLGERAQLGKFPFGEIWGLVVRSATSTKGTAVRFLAAHLGATPEEVVVVGDWWNDLPMFEVAGRSFAMGQAPDEVKAAATDVLEATSVTGGGVAEAAKRAGIVR